MTNQDFVTPIAVIAGPLLLAALNARLAAASNERQQKMLDIAKATHTLVNSQFGAQLKLTATVSRRMAELTQAPADMAAADAAEKLLAEHEGKQSVVDGAQPA